MNHALVQDTVEIQQLLTRYAVAMSAADMDAVRAVFTPDGTYSAFGDTYGVADFLGLATAAPKGLYSVGLPAVDVDGDSASGVQPLCFILQADHSVRIGYYTDTYRRTQDGWRLHARAMTFLRRSGARDAGRPDDPERPAPSAPGADRP